MNFGCENSYRKPILQRENLKKDFSYSPPHKTLLHKYMAKKGAKTPIAPSTASIDNFSVIRCTNASWSGQIQCAILFYQRSSRTFSESYVSSHSFFKNNFGWLEIHELFTSRTFDSMNFLQSTNFLCQKSNQITFN